MSDQKDTASVLVLYEHDLDESAGVELACARHPLGLELAIDVDKRARLAAYLGLRDVRRLARWLLTVAAGESRRSRLLRPQDVVEIYPMFSTATLERMRRTGRGPKWLRVGGGKRGRVAYRETDIEEYLVECEQLPRNGAEVKP